MGTFSGSGRVPRELVFTDAVYEDFVEQAKLDGVQSGGYHNRNYVLPLTAAMARDVGREPGTNVTVRIRKPEAVPVVIRTWEHEAEILAAIGGVLPHVPQCLDQREGSAIHSYVEGVPLSTVCPAGKPVHRMLIDALAGLLAQMSLVPPDELPALPAGWPPGGGDSQAFLHTLVKLADRHIRQPNWAVFGGLFAALGIPEDALVRLAERVPAMAHRPYSLLHADLHRDNVIVTYRGDPPLICVDWELATYGDPLHDLATHLVRMRYPEVQWHEVIESWTEAVEAVRPMAANGFSRDLRHYVAFERAQSVYPDVMRAARTLEYSLNQTSLDRATASVGAALRAAADPLRLVHVPDEDEIERVLVRWQASRHDRRPGSRGRRTEQGWTPDEAVAERSAFPRAAILEALIAEGAAPAERVFKGTTHLNSVVRVPGVASPVMVRRKVASAGRRERGYLSEHAVLMAVERPGIDVAAPKVLASGTSHGRDPFAVHTYEGTHGGDRPPSHPVDGLLPREADGLIGQLCALTLVDPLSVDPAATELAHEGHFHEWLVDKLVDLVDRLPKESRQLARVLGLPDAYRLAEILSRHRVTSRRPALLHGDLNPWNLVRRDDPYALTLIDWEMALVGDPLYDLVRHMHLTPTRPEIRDRMFRRWAGELPSTYTKDWECDWQVYRRIETVRSAYVDLDRLVTGASLDAPNVNRAVRSYGMTLRAAQGALGLPPRELSNPYLVRALPDGGHDTAGHGRPSAEK